MTTQHKQHAGSEAVKKHGKKRQYMDDIRTNSALTTQVHNLMVNWLKCSKLHRKENDLSTKFNID
jgi:hypothetical protein